MRSNLGRLRRTSSRSLVEQLATLTSVGDGSTLSLDFTTGVLDPRLTFQRLSNATFINSSGQVQYADANMVVNADLVGAGAGNTPTGWTGSTGINLTIPATGVRRAATTTAAQNWIQSGTFSTAQGLTYSSSVLVTEVSGQHYANTIGITGGATVVQYYRNGSTVGQFDTAVAGLVTVVWTATTTNTHNVRCGIGSTGANVANATCEVTQPRTIVGNIAQPAYFANSSTTAAYHAPRFDYDPTSIGTPRGLLIEGSANNLALRSNDFSTTVTDGTQWSVSGYTGTATSTTLPDGTTGNTLRISTASGAGSVRSSTLTVSQNTTYTWSFWARNNGGSQARFRVWNVTNGSSIVDYTQSANNYVSQIGGANNTSSTWVRVSVTFTTPAGCTSIWVYPASSDSGTVDLFVWGAQVEAGSGASSYIPTGSSTGSRAADVCYSDNISSWYTQGIGTMLFVGRPIQSVTRNYLGFSTGTNPPRLLLYGSTATEVILYLENSTGANLVFPSGSTTLGSVNRMAASFEQAGYSCVLNGGAVGTSTTASPAMPTSGINRMNIGMRNDQFNQFYGHVVQVKYWPYRLPDAQLKSITT